MKYDENRILSTEQTIEVYFWNFTDPGYYCIITVSFRIKNKKSNDSVGKTDVTTEHAKANQPIVAPTPPRVRFFFLSNCMRICSKKRPAPSGSGTVYSFFSCQIMWICSKSDLSFLPDSWCPEQCQNVCFLRACPNYFITHVVYILKQYHPSVILKFWNLYFQI